MALTELQKRRANAIKAALISAGLSGVALENAMAQVAHETGGFKSRVLSDLNNASGIKWANKAYQKATKGSVSPEGNYYAKYANLYDWAKDYVRIINKANKPLAATDTATFAQRLKENKYFTDTVANYQKGLEAWKKALSSAGINGESGATQGVLFVLIIVAFVYLSQQKNFF